MSRVPSYLPLLAQETPEAAGKPYLGDPAVIERLVRDFFGAIWGNTLAASDGSMFRAGAIAANEAADIAFRKVISGQDAAYVPLGGWNANETGGLKSFLRCSLDGGHAPRRAGARPFRGLRRLPDPDDFRRDRQIGSADRGRCAGPDRQHPL